MTKLVLIQIILALFLFMPLFSQEAITDSTLIVVDTLQQDFGLFTNDDILHLALRFDLKEYTRKKPKDEYLKATLTYYINDKDSINKEIRLKSRGEFRNGYCSFPPLSLNFSKAGFNNSELKKIEKIKMVTHCQYGNEEYLLKEYLIYKLYNVLTDYSFRVRLAKINYISSTGKSKTISSYSFLIEPLDILAERTKSVPVPLQALTQKNIIPEMMDRVAIFNYMIGNTDWSVPGQHNCKILSGSIFNQPALGIIVPYDFDYCGLVNADYAIPTEGLGIEHVTQRRYLGECRTDEVYIQALNEFSEKKPQFYRVINEFPYLKDKTKKGMIRYFDEFYSNLDKINGIIHIFSNECKEF